MTDEPAAATDLRRRIDAKAAVVGVIGLGYVGLPLLRAFFQAGFPVSGFDIDPAKIDALKAGRNYLKHLGEALVREMAGSARFTAAANFGRLGEADAVICCVPTPLGPHLEPDRRPGHEQRAADGRIAAGLRLRHRLDPPQRVRLAVHRRPTPG